MISFLFHLVSFILTVIFILNFIFVIRSVIFRRSIGDHILNVIAISIHITTIRSAAISIIIIFLRSLSIA